MVVWGKCLMMVLQVDGLLVSEATHETECRVQWSGLYEQNVPVLMLLPGCGVRIAETETQCIWSRSGDAT